MAGGTGNLILKRGTLIPDESVLLKGMPAVQLNGSSPINLSGDTETAIVNTENRLFIGSDKVTCTGTTLVGECYPGGPGGSQFCDTAPCSTINVGSQPRRPLWMGAEIRAKYPVYQDTDTYPTILKADWSKPSDVVLVTQLAIASYIQTGTGLQGPIADGSIAMLSGEKPGTQTFQLPIAVEQKFSVNAYSYSSVNYPATISCDNGTVASIFDTNITDLSIGGAAELIEIGDASTDGATVTTIYGDLSVTGTATVGDIDIDGGFY